eukprot:c17842_g1_i2 orf=657-1946(-)
MNARQPPIDSSARPTTSALLAFNTEWQQHRQQHQQQHHHQQVIYREHGLQEAMWQAPFQPQGGVVHQYPERRGEPDCPYYMRTGLCGFGVNCKFNHPPNSKLVLNSRASGQFPERPGQPDCQYYLKTGTCKFGPLCKYHHPQEKVGTAGGAELNILNLPLRPGEKDCAYYLRTGTCKYGATCKFNHPPPLMSVPGRSNMAPILVPPGQVHIPPWNPYHQVPLPFQEGQQQAMSGNYMYPAVASPHEHVAVRMIPPFASSSGPGRLATPLTPSMPGQREEAYPERPGEPECSYYMKTGGCKFGLQCKFHHPRDRNTCIPTSYGSPSGLPLRPGAPPCTFFSRFGFCKFGSTCKFDHSVQTEYTDMPADTATTNYRVDGLAAPPSASIMSSLAEVSPGQHSKTMLENEDVNTLSASIQQLDVHHKHHNSTC